MKIFARVLLIVVALILQVTVLDIGYLQYFRPDFLLIMLTWLALSSDTILAIEYGFLLGLVQDIFSGGPMGLNTLAKIGIGFFDSTLRKNIIINNPVNRMIVVMVNTIVQALLIVGIIHILSPSVLIGSVLDRTLLYRMLFHGILSLPIMWAMDKTI
jgi:rod shape-determining protein MreD